MIYLIEVRNTVGAYKTVAACYNLADARKIFEETKKNNGFGQGRPEVLEIPKGQKKDPSIKAWAKVGGTTHHNTIVRIKEVPWQELRGGEQA